MQTEHYTCYDLMSPGESSEERGKRIAYLIERASTDKHVFLDAPATAKDDKPRREEMLRSLRAGDTILVYSLPNLGYPKERLELWRRIKDLGAKVKFTHKPSQKVWAVMESLSEVSEMDRKFQTAAARKNRIRKSGGRPKGFSDIVRASVAYKIAETFLPSSEYTNSDIMDMINRALPVTCKPYNTGLYWQKHARQYAAYIGAISHDPILGEGVPLKLPKKEFEKFLKLGQSNR